MKTLRSISLAVAAAVAGMVLISPAPMSAQRQSGNNHRGATSVNNHRGNSERSNVKGASGQSISISDRRQDNRVQTRKSDSKKQDAYQRVNSKKQDNNNNKKPQGNTKPQGNNGKPNSDKNHGYGHGNNGNNSNHGNGGYQGGNSHSRPGTGAMKPNQGHNQGYKPGHNQGYGHNHYNLPRQARWERPLPPPPARFVPTRAGIPFINSVLGLTFGSYLDPAINLLLNAGYTIASVMDNAIYLDNVAMFGYRWPEATIYYDGGLMNGARFQHASHSSSNSRYRKVYNQLCRQYGAPVSSIRNHGVLTTTWWGGGGNGYITLSFGPGYNQYGSSLYYTDLVYGR